MFKKIDITFYDIYYYDGDIPSIDVTNENFYIAFSIYNELNEPFINNSIYYPVVYFNDINKTEIKVEPCDSNKMGTKYKTLFNEYNLKNYHCLNEVNHTLRAYENSFFIQLFPCKNSTENNYSCQPKEIIDESLNGKNLEILFEDIILTPLDYKNPVHQRVNFLYTTIFKNFGQYLYTEMQLLNIETNTNIIGFDFLQQNKIEYYIKYDTLEIIPQPGYDLEDNNNNYPICEIEFQLKDKILLEKRQYIQLFDILGEIGGFMEIFNSFFGIICSFFANILYNIFMSNNLFSFDLNENNILIKENIKNHVNELHLINKNKISERFKTNEYSNNLVKEIKLKNRLSKHYTDINIPKSDKYRNKKININYRYDKMKESNLRINLKDKGEKENKNGNYKKRNYVHNILLDESTRLISKELDIFGIFKNMYYFKFLKNENIPNYKTVKMSDNSRKNLANFMRRLLVHRFESSISAFKISLENMISTSENILNWIRERKTIPVYKRGNLPDIEEMMYTSNDDGPDMFGKFELDYQIEKLNAKDRKSVV